MKRNTSETRQEKGGRTQSLFFKALNKVLGVSVGWPSPESSAMKFANGYHSSSLHNLISQQTHIHTHIHTLQLTKQLIFTFRNHTVARIDNITAK